jgi:hypothetical protein
MTPLETRNVQRIYRRMIPLPTLVLNATTKADRRTMHDELQMVKLMLVALIEEHGDAAPV